MPDFSMWYKPRVLRNGEFAGRWLPGEVVNHVKSYVAEQMDCRGDDGRMLIHDWKTQITCLTFAPLADEHAETLVVIQIFAYDWPDRMDNIDERLQGVGKSVRALLELPEGSVDISFIKLDRPTPEQSPCWVNV